MTGAIVFLKGEQQRDRSAQLHCVFLQISFTYCVFLHPCLIFLSADLLDITSAKHQILTVWQDLKHLSVHCHFPSQLLSACVCVFTFKLCTDNRLYAVVTGTLLFGTKGVVYVVSQSNFPILTHLTTKQFFSLSISNYSRQLWPREDADISGQCSHTEQLLFAWWRLVNLCLIRPAFNAAFLLI